MDTCISCNLLSVSASRFLNNETFVLRALKKNAEVLGYVSERLYYNVNFVLEALRQNGMCLEYCSVYRNTSLEEELTATAVRQNGLAIQFAKPCVLTETIIELAVFNNWRALTYVPHYRPSKPVLRHLLNKVVGRRAAIEITSLHHLLHVLQVPEGRWVRDLYHAVEVLRQSFLVAWVVHRKTNSSIFYSLKSE